MTPIAEVAFDLSYTPDKISVRLFAPEPVANSEDWACTFEIDEPLALRRTLYGVSSLQALVLALKSLSSNLMDRMHIEADGSASPASSAATWPFPLPIYSWRPPLILSDPWGRRIA